MGGDFRVALQSCNDDGVSSIAGQCHAMMCRAMALMFECVAELKERGAIDRDGARSTAAWLRAQLHVSAGTSRDWAAVIDRVDDLPATQEKFEEGCLSFDQFRQLARFATAENEAELAEDAPSRTVPELSRMAAAHEKVEPDEAKQALAERRFRCAWYEGDNSWRLWGRLPALEGQQVKDVLEGIAAKAPANPATGTPDAHDVRLADALVEAVNGPASADVSLHVHCDAADLFRSNAAANERPRVPPHPEHGPIVAEPVLRQLACTARWTLYADRPDGTPFGVGRLKRRAPHTLSRYLHRRDTVCRWPGCDHSRFLQMHHIKHWSRGGHTDSDQVILLCGYHHRFLHHHGWRIEGNADTKTVGFIRSDGTRLPESPPQLSAETLNLLRRE